MNIAVECCEGVVACVGRSGKGARRQAATLHWRGLRFAATSLRCSGSWPRRQTHCARCVRCVQTAATSQLLMRAARAATSPALLGAPEARRRLPARSFEQTSAASPGKAAVDGCRGGRCPAGAIWVATSSAGSGSARASAPRCLTRRRCLSAMSAANAASSATRPRPEQRSAVDAQRRPPPNEPPPGSAHRDARHQRTTTPAPKAD